jgi:hypothetical protein
MQRYEREVNEILRGLGCDIMPEDPQVRANGPQSSESPGDDASQLQHARPARPVHPIAEKVIAGACLLLAMALPLLVYGSAISALLIVLTLMLLLVSLKYGRRTRRAEDDLSSKDLRWKDVAVRARPDTPGTPRKRDDSFWSI